MVAAQVRATYLANQRETTPQNPETLGQAYGSAPAKNSPPGKETTAKPGKRRGKKRLEYKEIALKDGTVFKGMVAKGTSEQITKKKHLSGTGEMTSA